MNYTYLDCLASFGVGGAHPGGLQLTRNILAREYIDQDKSILDVGCGTGQTSAYIASMYQCAVTAMDINNTMLDKAKQRFSSLHLPITVLNGDIENLPFADGTFDFILSESVISFTNVSLTLKELKRVLRPDGILVAVEMVPEDSLTLEELKTMVDFYGVSNLLTESEWHKILYNAGFKEISIEKFKLQFNQNDVDTAPDFILSENINEELLEILDKHKNLTTTYKDKLSYCVFRCCV